ncbi:MAG: hypothetical protein SVV03_04485 [Candidatus Nanohaloarchaea archaeon]|nr:hypothetical protein [Candidatus Nanohaloarchaea archaeon]
MVKMGKIAQFFTGLFIAGAGYALRLVNQAIGASAANSPLPFDVTKVLIYVSTGFLGIGGILVGYTLVVGAYGLTKMLFFEGKAEEPKEPEERERRRGEREEERHEGEERTRDQEKGRGQRIKEQSRKIPEEDGPRRDKN